jgi:hypothetical protein
VLFSSAALLDTSMPMQWTSAEVMFPGIDGGSACPTALWAAPFLTLRGHVYAAASTTQFCLYPVDHSREDTLLLRRVSFNSTAGAMVRGPYSLLAQWCGIIVVLFVAHSHRLCNP